MDGNKVIHVDLDAKCGGCNWESERFYALDGQNPLPSTVTDDDDETPLDDYKDVVEEYKQLGEPVGMCSQCFMDWLEEVGALVSTT